MGLYISGSILRAETGDTDAMLALLKNYWGAVADIFPTAWDSAPRRSRLVHGVGILALGRADGRDQL